MMQYPNHSKFAESLHNTLTQPLYIALHQVKTVFDDLLIFIKVYKNSAFAM
jgi:hypothetical protein